MLQVEACSKTLSLGRLYQNFNTFVKKRRYILWHTIANPIENQEAAKGQKGFVHTTSLVEVHAYELVYLNPISYECCRVIRE